MNYYKLLSVIFLFTCSSLFAQNYYSLVDSNKTWTEKEFVAMQQLNLHVYQTTNDTIINSVSYYKLMHYDDTSGTNPSLYGYLRENSNKEVYLKLASNGVEKLIYSFDINVNDTVIIEDHFPPFDSICSVVVDSLDSIYIGNNYRKRYYLSNAFNLGLDDVWVEGIGSIKYGLTHPGYAYVGAMYDLLCYKENDTLKYMNPLFNKCVIIGSISEDDLENGLQVYPNPFSTSTTIHFDQSLNGEYDLLVFDIVGKELIRKERVTGNKVQLQQRELGEGLFLAYLINNETKERIFVGKLVAQE